MQIADCNKSQEHITHNTAQPRKNKFNVQNFSNSIPPTWHYSNDIYYM